MKNILLKSVILFITGAFLWSCSGSSDGKSQNELSGTISIDGSSTVYPITEAVAEEFRAEFPRVNITVGVSGTGGGFNKFGRGESDISNASRPIKEQEIALCESNNITYVQLKIAFDGLAVVANPENDWLESITVEELRKIWEPAAQNVVKRWNQIRPEWPNEEIRLYGPGVASGTYDYFTEAIVGKSGSSRGDFTASEDDNVLVQGIAGDKYGLGFFGLAYFEENQNKLKLVAVDGGQGAVLPSLETVSNNSYTPLSRPMFIYVNSTAIERSEVIEFVRFYLDNTGELTKEVGYVPLPESEYEAEKQKLETFISENGKVS